MAKILCIETSGETCSIALFNGDELIGALSDDAPFSHSSKLTVLIEEILLKNNCVPDLVAVSCGPGSYTGLRIGVTTAKGLAYGYSIPLVSIDTMKLMAQGFLNSTKINDGDVIVPMIDARRMEVFATAFDYRLQSLMSPKALILDESSFMELNSSSTTHFIGTGAAKANGVLKLSDSRYYVEEGKPQAKFMGKMARDKMINKDFENVAYFEPDYMKEFYFHAPKS
mgnify:CR=1 FL=1